MLLGVGANAPIFNVAFAARWAAGSLLEKLLFDVRPTDLPTYAVVCGVLATVGILAGYLAARTASHIDPNAALRVL